MLGTSRGLMLVRLVGQGRKRSLKGGVKVFKCWLRRLAGPSRREGCGGTSQSPRKGSKDSDAILGLILITELSFIKGTGSVWDSSRVTLYLRLSISKNESVRRPADSRTICLAQTVTGLRNQGCILCVKKRNN